MRLPQAQLRPTQTRAASAAEAGVSVVVGLVLALATQRLVFPLFNIGTTVEEELAIATLFTAVSLARSTLLRRLFERQPWFS